MDVGGVDDAARRTGADGGVKLRFTGCLFTLLVAGDGAFHLAADDINTYADTGGQLTLWPVEFAKPARTQLGERNLWHIPVALRPHYWRTAEVGQLPGKMEG